MVKLLVCLTRTKKNHKIKDVFCTVSRGNCASKKKEKHSMPTPLKRKDEEKWLQMPKTVIEKMTVDRDDIKNISTASVMALFMAANSAEYNPDNPQEKTLANHLQEHVFKSQYTYEEWLAIIHEAAAGVLKPGQNPVLAFEELALDGRKLGDLLRLCEQHYLTLIAGGKQEQSQ